MCGFLTAFYKRETPLEGLRAGLERMIRRGPDGEGEWNSSSAYLGHRRLAILDLDDRASQPMLSRCGRYRIVFNGEIYNFRRLRELLQTEGSEFRTTSDTEVILEGFACWGTKLLSQLHGMFAFVIWDEQLKRGFAARDPYGIKPLYVGRFDSGVILASQVKAILNTGLVSHEPCGDGQAGFWLLGSVPEPYTWYRDISSLPAGSYCWIENSQIKTIESWFDIGSIWRDAPACTEDDSSVARAVQACLRESVQRHLVSDVPVGVFLSGGIDSGALSGLMCDAGARDLLGVTIHYSEYEGTKYDESPDAAVIARCYGIEHHVRKVTKQEFFDDLPTILDSMDQPSVDGVNTWYAAKATKELGLKVVISGVGGDELFLGYGSFKTLPRLVSLWSKLRHVPCSEWIAKLATEVQGAVTGNRRWAFAPNLLKDIRGAWLLRRGLMSPTDAARSIDFDGRFGISPDSLLDRYGKARPGEFPSDPQLSLAQLESTMYLRNQLLRDSDWSSMYHSVELRTPLVDAHLLISLQPYLRALPKFPKKTLLANSPSKPLPSVVSNRAKTGFSIPVYQWLEELSQEQRGTKAVAWAKYVVSNYSLATDEADLCFPMKAVSPTIITH
ncbi:MAG: asparagine synthase (glutamine-hydrolyzing) [Pirellula sp.]